MEVSIGQNKILTQVSSEYYWITCKAESRPSGEQIWFKILSQELNSDDELVSRFHESAEISISLRHPNILSCYEHGYEEGLHYITIEHFEGKRLSDVLKEEKKLSPERVLCIIVQIAKALQYAHINGVLHGMLNTDCIFIDQKDFVKVTNFGAQELTKHFIFNRKDEGALQLSRYISPEQTTLSNIPTGQSDIYSLGVIFYELLTGAVPFIGKNLEDQFRLNRKNSPPDLQTINAGSPQYFNLIISKQLAKIPAERYPNCSSLLYDMVPDYKEKLLQDSDLDFTERAFRSKIGSWISRFFPDHFSLLSPTLVGSRRRIALTIVSFSVVIAVIVLVTLLSSLGIQSSNKNLYTYLDWMADENKEDTSTNNEKLTATPQNKTGNFSANPSNTASEPETEVLKPTNQNVSFSAANDENTELGQSSGLESLNEQDHSEIQQDTETGILPGKEFGSIVLTTTTDSLPTIAMVYLDENFVGKTDLKEPLRIIQVAANQPHTLRITKNGYREFVKKIQIKPNGQEKYAITMQPQPDAIKRFYFKAVSFADRIIIDDQLPSRPLPCEIDLPIGKHAFKYVDSRNEFSWNARLYLDLDSSEEIYFDPKNVGYGNLAVVIRNAFRFGYAYVQLDGDTDTKRTTPYRARVPVGRHNVKVMREGFGSLPADTSVFVSPGKETSVIFELFSQ